MEMEYVTVGVIANTHGLRGDVRILSRTDFANQRFRKGSKFFVRMPAHAPIAEVEVAVAKQHKQYWLLQFKGLESIEAVESFKGMELCVPVADLQALPEGTYYIHQLVGLQVHDDVRGPIGIVKDVLTPGANDVYVVRQSGRKDDILIPAISDCVLNVDLDAGVMHVHLLPGLLEDEEKPDR